MTTNINRDLTNLFKQRVDERASECEDCGGSGLDGLGYGQVPCTTCADLRELSKELNNPEVSAWIYDPDGGNQPMYKKPSIQSLRKLLERMGAHDYESFLEWLWHSYLSHISAGKRYKDFGDICQSDELMAQAVLEYLKGRASSL